MTKSTVYKLTDGDKAIFAAAKDDPNIFLNYYMKSNRSGTYWTPGAKHARWAIGYDKLLKSWKTSGKPGQIELKGNHYRVDLEHDTSRKYPGMPVFFHNHGVLALDWAKELYFDRTPIRTIVGGWGSGKTMNLVLLLLVYAATLPGFRAFCLGPQHKQAKEMFRIARNIIANTPYFDRFVSSIKQPPDGKIVISNDLVGESSIEFYSIHNNPDVLLSLTGDCAIFDQAEQADNLQHVIESIGSRLRGREMNSGRQMLGTLTFIANAADNPELWDIFDRREEDPENYLSIQPSSYDNPYLTDADLNRLELYTSGSKDKRAQKLMGARPLGNGSVFSQQSLELMQDPSMDVKMAEALDQELPGYIFNKASKVGCYEWILPPEPGRTYLVVSDPGTKNPPHRDSPPIFVWDITDFPGTEEAPMPAKLQAFVWVYGNGTIKNWADKYAELVVRYKAQSTNAFDATGFQSGYTEWIAILSKLFPEPINLSGGKKASVINSSRILSSNGMMKMPAAVDAVYNQLSRYEFPEPDSKRMKQDITIAFAMSCWWLQRLYFISLDEEEDREYEESYAPRNKRSAMSRNRRGSR